MCGRFVRHTSAAALARLAGALVAVDAEPAQSWNVAPDRDVLAVRGHGAARELVRLRWGLLPAWSRDPRIAHRLINARMETLASKPAFRSAYRQRRCLVPADGFYEWTREGDARQPWYIRRNDGEPMWMAGLWERWAHGGTVVESCTIVTREANADVRDLHDRMPALVERAALSDWLDTDDGMRLPPSPAGTLIRHRVSRRVNRPANDGPENIEPLPENIDDAVFPVSQPSLFGDETKRN